MSEKDADNQIVKRFLEDDDFRARLLDDPDGTLAAEGLTASSGLKEKLKSSDKVAIENAVRAHKSGTTNATC